LLEVRQLLASDFGDAPLPYPTLLSENGAAHLVVRPKLGTYGDTEDDGVHSAGADGDDNTGTPDDEDGVTFGRIRAGMVGATVTVKFAGPSAKLDAWIDFNRDGSWGGPLEQIADRVALVTGNNTIKFDVPSWAANGTTYVRFRMSTAGNLGVRGQAANGEVEDYAVTVQPPKLACGCFSAHTVAVGAETNGAIDVSAADVDGDGDTDVLSASGFGDKIAWYENDGNRNFIPHTITTAADWANSVTAADVDGDGDTDVLSTSFFDHTVAWYENDGGQNFTAHTITAAAYGAVDVFAADVDGDGDNDVLSASGGDDKIAWYENDGNQNFTAHTIATGLAQAFSVFAADVDSDGDTDVLHASRLDGQFAWYENDGSQNFTAHTIGAFPGANTVFAADMDDDGDTDVLTAADSVDQIAWYENDGHENFTLHSISTTADRPFSVFPADMDGDGDMDVLSASNYDDKVAWYENDGSQNFTAHAITTAADNANSVFAADVDGDGDLDVLSASFYDDKIAWYENRRANPPSPAPPGPIGPFGTTVVGERSASLVLRSYRTNVRTILGESSDHERQAGGTNRPGRHLGATDGPGSWEAGLTLRETLPFLDDMMVDALDF
jgi:hypothetical protein